MQYTVTIKFWIRTLYYTVFIFIDLPVKFMHLHTGGTGKTNLQTLMCSCSISGESMRRKKCVQLPPARKKHAFCSATQCVFATMIASNCFSSRRPGWSVSQWTRATAGDGRRAFLFTVQMMSSACVWSCEHWPRIVETAFTAKRIVITVSLWRISDAIIVFLHMRNEFWLELLCLLCPADLLSPRPTCAAAERVSASRI